MNSAFAQTPSYPDKIRGYKVERAVVEVKKPETKSTKSQQPPLPSTSTPAQDGSSNLPTVAQPSTASDVDSLIKLEHPQLARLTPLGVTFEVSITVAPIKQSGHADFLLFEDMVINGHSVEIDEYHRAFDLPNKQPLTLREPLRIYLYLPTALLAAVDEWTNSKETWPVTGRIYVCGKFKKTIFTFKRCVPVELNTNMRNPFKESVM